MKKTVLLALLALVLAAPSWAQAPVPNPGKVEYTVSVDHAALTKYVIGFFLPGATDPVQMQDLPIVAPGADQKVLQPINTTPLGFGTYIAKMRSVAGTVASEWSAPSNELERSPLPPGNVRAVK
jgi:hypothetical protein